LEARAVQATTQVRGADSARRRPGPRGAATHRKPRRPGDSGQSSTRSTLSSHGPPASQYRVGPPPRPPLASAGTPIPAPTSRPIRAARQYSGPQEAALASPRVSAEAARTTTLSGAGVPNPPPRALRPGQSRSLRLRRRQNPGRAEGAGRGGATDRTAGRGEEWGRGRY
jgi:hypothetical protein